MDIVLLLGLVVLIGVAINRSDSSSTHEEVYVIRTNPQPSGCGPTSFFFLGVVVCLIVILLFITAYPETLVSGSHM